MPADIKACLMRATNGLADASKTMAEYARRLDGPGVDVRLRCALQAIEVAHGDIVNFYEGLRKEGA